MRSGRKHLWLPVFCFSTLALIMRTKINLKQDLKIYFQLGGKEVNVEETVSRKNIKILRNRDDFVKISPLKCMLTDDILGGRQY